MPLRSAAVSVDTYLDAVRARLAADGCAVTTEMLGPIPVTVGYKGEFKALTKVHVFTVVAGFGRVDEATVRRFTDDAANLAKSRKGQWRGAQSGVLVLPVLVSPAVDPGVVALMRKAYRLNLGGFAAMAQPAVVDLNEGRVHTFRGTRVWGMAYNGLIKKTVARYVPEPQSA